MSSDGTSKWCAACDQSFVTLRESCPKCLCTLMVGEVAASVECRNCGQSMNAAMDGCPRCGTSVARDLAAGGLGDEFAEMIARGVLMPRPKGTTAFAEGAKCSLRTLSLSGQRAIVGPAGFIEAHLEPTKTGLDCVDVDGSLLFHLVAYEATESSAFSAFDDEGNSLGTFIRSSALRHQLDVRDGTSAPVGRLSESNGDWPYEVRETGGGVFAQLRVSTQYIQTHMDDAWSLRSVLDTKAPLELRGMIAMMVAAKLLIGGRLQRRPAETEATEEYEGGWLAALGGSSSWPL